MKQHRSLYSSGFFVLVLSVVVSMSISGSTAYAAEEEKPAGESAEAKDEKKELINTGVIANTGSYADGSAVDVDTQGATPGDEPPVIQGSVSPTGRDACTATVSNGSEENSYSIRFRVEGKNERGQRTINKTYSALLKPGGKTTRKIKCSTDDRMSLVLLSAKKR